jgi:hypothetical protein
MLKIFKKQPISFLDNNSCTRPTQTMKKLQHFKWYNRLGVLQTTILLKSKDVVVRQQLLIVTGAADV